MGNKTMKKNSFISGAFITTLGIVISKILGILYVIPFHAIIGEQGGALYGYAYTIYALFMSLATAGIPLAISKLVSEYQTLGYYNAKKRAFVLAKKIALLFGFICFVVLMLFAPIISKAILGDLVGGNTLKDVTFVVRVIATAILIVPVLSIYRGYFEGHRFMSPPSISQVIEQIVRVLVIVLGSYFALSIFNLKLTSAVGIALFGATVGAIFAYTYLVYKKCKNKKRFDEKIRDVNEPIITDKMIIKKIMAYAIPFILIDLFKAMYNYIDMVTVVKGLVSIANFSVNDAESIMGYISTWSAKFNMIILAISTGIIVSLIPNLTQSVVKMDKKEINRKINQALSILLFFMVPMTIGLSFLSEPVWMLFYGASKYGPSVLSLFIFVGLFMGLFTASVSIVQVLRDYKTVFVSLVVGVMLKFIFNNSLISTFYKLGLPAYFGAITSSIIAYLVSFIICLIVLYFKYNIDYEDTIRHLFDVLSGSMLMIIVLFVLKLFIPIVSSHRVVNLFIILAYSLVGLIVYIVFSYRCGVAKSIFGDKIKKISKK